MMPNSLRNAGTPELSRGEATRKITLEESQMDALKRSLSES